MSGCSSCCYRKIEVTISESDMIYRELEKSGLWGRVKEECISLQKFISLDSSVWFKSEIKCPVLDEDSKTCMAYGVRPVVCASHFVRSNPENCSPGSSGDYDKVDMEFIKMEFLKDMESMKGSHANVILPLPLALLISEKSNTNGKLLYILQ
jgi:Fe-S-cluster containining protein